MELPGNRDKKIIDGTHRIVFYLLPLLGLAFLLWYIKNAACDVVYSDYIRLVNSYLPDVFNPENSSWQMCLPVFPSITCPVS